MAVEAEKTKYRSYLSEEEEVKNIHWRYGPPNYDLVDKLFEEGRTKVWLFILFYIFKIQMYS